MGDSPPLSQDGSMWWLPLLVLGMLAVVVLLTGWTGWRVYRQPSAGRLVEHGVLVQLWLWVWIIAGPYYPAQWGYWLPALFLAYLLLLAGRIGVAQRARKSHK